MDNKILNIEMTNFSLSHVTWPYLGRTHAKKWSNCIYIAITFEILVQNGYLDSSCHVLSKNINFI